MTLSPMMEFTIEDFPTPPFPITSIVKESTFYTKLHELKEKKEHFFRTEFLMKHTQPITDKQ